MVTLKDKNGNMITVGNKTTDDDVIYDGKHYYRIYENNNEYNKPTGIEMISCTNGYVHGVHQNDMVNFERIGKYKGNEHLFECD